jgi:hypothetical protein
MEKIKFMISEDEEVEFYIIEQTQINGYSYILVTDSEDDEEAEALILKDLSALEETEAVYEIVEDDTELDYVSKIFEEILEDIDIER